jgi:hypothetical protein
MKLVQEFVARAFLKPPLPIGPGPFGNRVFYEVTGGRLEGDRVRADVLGGGEWALLGADGYVRIDVRLQARTDDDALLYLQYAGLLEVNEAVQAAMTGAAGTDYGTHAFYTNPRVETGDPRYAWMNTTFFIGEGHLLPGLGVEYRVWRPA